MAVDASIYGALGTRPKSVEDYDAQNQQFQQNALNIQRGKQQLDAYTQDQAEKASLRNLLSGPNTPDLSTAAGHNALMAAAPTLGPGIYKNFQDGLTSQALAKKDTAQAGNFDADAAKTTQQTHFDLLQHGIQSLTAASTPQAAIASVNDGVAKGYWSMQDAQQKIANIPTDPGAYQDWRIQQLKTILPAADLLKANMPTTSTHNTGASTVTLATDPLTGKTAPVSTIANTVSPDTIATTATTRRGQDMTQQTQYTLGGLDAQGKDAGGGTGGLSPAAIENAATRYNVDGTLPPQLGRGTQGARDMRAIQNRAAELSMGTDPAQLRVNQLDAKSASTALTQLTKAQTMAASFENTANQNADLALSLSKKNDRTGIPILNAGLQAWRTGTGSPEATQFAAANETFVNEYAKIMSGGMGNSATSDAASKRAHDLLSTGMTDGQYEGNVRLLQQEMRNRMKGYDDQTQAVRARIGGKGAAPAAVPAGKQPTVSNW